MNLSVTRGGAQSHGQTVDSTKVVGLSSLPGAMTGILAGIAPLTAIRYQIVVMYMLLSAATLAAVRLARTVLFDDAHRLHELTTPNR